MSITKDEAAVNLAFLNNGAEVEHHKITESTEHCSCGKLSWIIRFEDITFMIKFANEKCKFCTFFCSLCRIEILTYHTFCNCSTWLEIIFAQVFGILQWHSLYSSVTLILSAVQEFKDVINELQSVKRSKFKERTEESSATQYFQVNCYPVVLKSSVHFIHSCCYLSVRWNLIQVTRHMFSHCFMLITEEWRESWSPIIINRKMEKNEYCFSVKIF